MKNDFQWWGLAENITIPQKYRIPILNQSKRSFNRKDNKTQYKTNGLQNSQHLFGQTSPDFEDGNARVITMDRKID